MSGYLLDFFEAATAQLQNLCPTASALLHFFEVLRTLEVPQNPLPDREDLGIPLPNVTLLENPVLDTVVVDRPGEICEAQLVDELLVDSPELSLLLGVKELEEMAVHHGVVEELGLGDDPVHS